MTPEDRELLLGLRRQQLELQRSLARLDVQLHELESRAVDAAVEPTPAEIPPHFPPIPPEVHPLIAPADEVASSLPPLPVIEPVPPAHHDFPPVPKPPVGSPSLEFQLGRWLTAIGALFGVITLALIFGWFHSFIYRLLGPGGILGTSALISIGVVVAGDRLDRGTDARRYVGRVIIAMALAWLYLTVYAACSYEPLRIITNPFLAGLLLLGWSAYVLLFAERKQSQILSLFAITLAYFSTSINPVGRFTMAADLLLAGTAVIFMVRNGWAALSYFSLAFTYYALLRRLIIDESGDLVLDTSRALHFWPYAIYLIGAWLIFTAAVIFTTSPTFRGGKRLAFLSLNNGAVAGLLLLTTYIAGYGHVPMGWVLLTTGFVFLVMSRFVGWAQIEPEKVMAAYAAQGLALFTAGIMVLYTGVTRGFLLMMETLFLGLAAAFSGDLVLTVTTYVAGFFATLFLIWEIALHAHHPWLLGFGGAIVMLLNAWWARGEVRHSPKERATVVIPTSYFCVLALGLIFTALCTELNESTLPPALALMALALTFLIYFVSIYELPPLAQTLLLSAQALVLFPIDTGEDFPWWTNAGVGAITLVMCTWWARQRVTRTGPWLTVLTFVYALTLAGLAYQTWRPWVDGQGWMVSAAFFSVVFLAWGAFNRVWPIALVGQLFLAVAVYHFLAPPGDVFPWTWWAAAVPVVVVFSTARATHSWLRYFTEIPAEQRTAFRALAYSYQLLALLMFIRWVVALVPLQDQVATLLLMGTAIFYWNLRPFSAFGLRCSFILTLTGLWLYGENLHALSFATFFNAFAFLGLLIQPGLLRLGTKTLSKVESWTLLLVSIAAGWFFVSVWVDTRMNLHYLTLSWTLYALFVFLLGLFGWERRQRWCGLGILLAAIVRVFFHDFWDLSSGYRVLTFFALTVITLGVGYLILRYTNRAKQWL